MAGKTHGEGGGSGGGSWITGGTAEGGGSYPSLRRSAGPTQPGTASCTGSASALYCSREIRPRTLSILSSALSCVRLSAATPVRGSGEVGEGRTGRCFCFFSSVLAVFVRVEVLQSFFSRFLRCLAAAANVTPLFLFSPLYFRDNLDRARAPWPLDGPTGLTSLGPGASAPSSAHVFNFSLSLGSLFVAHKRFAFRSLPSGNRNSTRHLCNGSHPIPTGTALRGPQRSFLKSTSFFLS